MPPAHTHRLGEVCPHVGRCSCLACILPYFPTLLVSLASFLAAHWILAVAFECEQSVPFPAHHPHIHC